MADALTSLTDLSLKGALWEEITRCAKCGQCRSQCPVFLESKEEPMVARGRISLIEALILGQVSTSYEGYQRAIKSCLKCLRCSSACPSVVKVDKIIQEARFQLAQKEGLGSLTRLIFRHLLPRPLLFERTLRLASSFQPFIMPRRKGAVRHLPLFFMGERWVPTLAKRTALKLLREEGNNFLKRPPIRVALFLGCLINYVYPEIALKAKRLLNSHGVEVVVPEGQLCCSTPLLSLGDSEGARALASRNLETFMSLKVDAVLTACASCCRTLKKDYPELLPAAEPLAKKVYDVGEFLYKFIDYRPRPSSTRVTYHDPCHLRWGLGIKEEPRALLNKACQYVEMEEAERCCGQGGTFSLFFYDLSQKIGAHKLQSIKASGAEVVATSCPGCLMQLQDLLASSGLHDVKAVHLLEVLEQEGEGQRIQR